MRKVRFDRVSYSFWRRKTNRLHDLHEVVGLGVVMEGDNGELHVGQYNICLFTLHTGTLRWSLMYISQMVGIRRGIRWMVNQTKIVAIRV